jgi:glucose-1-phosphate thymidylyltransferase
MKALILAGGEGTRLRPITHTRAKQLVPVANKPILFYGIEAMVAAGIEEIGVITGATGPEVRAAVGDGSDFGAKVTYIPQEAPLGLAHCVLVAADFLGADDFVMYLGDNLLEQDLAAFVAAFETARSSADPPAAQILLKQVPDPQRFGIATLDERGHVVELVEKPEHPASDLALVGVYLFDKTIHEAVRAIKPSARGELEITHAIQHLIEKGHSVHSHLVTGYWKDTGRLKDMLECNRIVLEGIERRVAGTVDESSELTGRIVIEEGAVVEDSILRGPVVIGAGTRVIRSYVGPFTSIAEDCVLSDAEIEYSIVLGNSSIDGVSRIEHSLIGKDVEVTRAPNTPNAHQLMVGDHSRVQIRS